MPRFQAGHFEQNLQLLDGLRRGRREQGCTMGQLALAWLLARATHVVPIPGTTQIDHLERTWRRRRPTLTGASRAGRADQPGTVSGPRYNAATLQRRSTPKKWT